MSSSKKKIKNIQRRRGLGSKEQRFLHVKEFSQGKPNELSLNVLEKKAAVLNEQPKRFGFWHRRRMSETEENPLVTTSMNEEGILTSESKKSSAGSNKKKDIAHRPRSILKGATVSSQENGILNADLRAEIEHRKKRRRRYRRFSLAIVVVACCIGLSVAGYWFYQEQVRLSTSVGVLHEACDIIEKTDETTIAIDSYFQSSFDDETINKATDLLNSLPKAREDLDSARVYAQKAKDKLDGSQRDKEAAEHVLATIVSRETMLDNAEKRLNDDVAAKKALDVVEQIKGNVDEANALLAQSAQVVSDTTKEHVEQSDEYTESAKEKLETANKLLEQAQSCYPTADFGVLSQYIDEKIKAASEALASNDAILIQDKKTAEAHNDAYNKADAEASKLAEDLPSDLSKIVVDAYATTQAPLTEEYEKARSDASVHDGYLRDYLGTNE